MHKKLIGAVLGLVLTFAVSSQAQAAPRFLLPDFDFASHDKGLISDGCSYFMNIDTSVGDNLVVDKGCGYSSICGSIQALDLNGCGWINVATSEGCVQGTLLTSCETGAPWGHDIFATFCVDQSSVCGIDCGTKLGLTLMAYNCTPIVLENPVPSLVNRETDCFNRCGLEWCKVKGDLAPVVPEPATLSLVVLGLAALGGTARRKLVG